MAFVKGQPFKPQFDDGNGALLSSGTIESYLWDTVTPTPMYTDNAGSGAANSLTLNARAEPDNDIFYDTSIVYKFVLKDSSGTTIYTLGPFYPTGSASSTEFEGPMVTALATLSAANLSTGDLLQTSGYTTAGDGGHGVYYWDSTDTTTDEGFLYRQLDEGGNGRFILIHDGVVDARQGGCLADDSTDNFTQANVITAATGITEIVFNGGIYQIETTNRYLETVNSESMPHGIRMFSNQILTVNADATLKQVAWGGAAAANDDSGVMIAVFNLDNVLIRGKGKLLGNYTIGGSYGSRAAATQHGVHTGNSTNITLSDLAFNGFWGDGTTASYIGDIAGFNNCRNVNHINCHFDSNRRNATSLVGCVGGSYVGGSGTTTTSGDPLFGPESGMDLEANSGVTNITDGSAFVTNIVVIGYVTKDNIRSGLSIGPPNSTDRSEVSKISIIGCNFEDRVVIERSSFITVSGCTIGANIDDTSSPFAPFAALDIIDSKNVTAVGNTINKSRGHGISVRVVASGLNECIDNTIVANSVSGVGLKTDLTYACIYVEGANNLIALNQLRHNAAGNGPVYGVQFIAGTSGNYNILNDATGFTGGSRKAWIDSSTTDDNTTLMLGGNGDKKFYVNVGEEAPVDETNQGIIIDQNSIDMAYTGGGSAKMLRFFDGTGEAGGVGVDGSEHAMYFFTPSQLLTGGSGSPEGVVPGNNGSQYGDTGGTTNSSIYKKETTVSLTITNITSANPAVVTYTGTDPSNTDVLLIASVAGMIEINSKFVTVANVDAGANTFECSGLNSSNFTDYSSGGKTYDADGWVAH